MTIEEAVDARAIDTAMDTFRANYDLATEQDAARMTQELLAQRATVKWAEYQVGAFIEQRLDDRERVVAKMRELALTVVPE